MRTQTLLWIPVPPPGGTAPGEPRISVMVSPRLRTDVDLPVPRLTQFPDFLDWPAAVSGIAWEVHLGGTVVPARPLLAPRSDLWTELFPPDTFVRPEVLTDLPSRAIRSYPVANVVWFLLDRWATVAAASPTDFPTVDALGGPDLLGPISYDPGSGTDAEAETVESILAQQQAVPPDPADPPLDFYQVRRFHQPRGASLVKLEAPDFDVHQVIALTADYPELQRLLGLVVDLELPMDALQGAGPELLLRVVPSWWPAIGADSIDQTPAVRCRVDADRLEALARSRPSVVRGHLPIGGEGYDVVQIDQDGAAIKAMNLAQTVQQGEANPSIGQTGREALPSLRSGGFAVARHGRALELVKELQRGKQLYDDTEAGAVVELDAEDLVHGYRLDVHHGLSDRWYPLLARDGRYTFTRSRQTLRFADEGVLRATPTGAPDGTGDLYLQETLFQWLGWSLAAARPGTAIAPDGTINPDPVAHATTYPLEVRFSVPPRTLPRLRFGSVYRFRMRVVDLAGASVPFDPQWQGEDPETMTAPVVYGRYEPVASPLILARRPMTANETVDRLVIRSDAGETATADSQRHVLGAAAAQLLAEHHGMFDESGPVSELDRGAWAAIGKREGLRLEDLPSARPDPGRKQEQFHDVDRLDPPYLPDPMSRGAAFQGLPGTGVLKASFAPAAGRPWFEQRGIRLVLAEGSAAASTWDPTARVVRVILPKAAQVTARLSTYLDEVDLSAFGIWQLLLNRKGADIDTLRSVAVSGQHWMLTPYRTVTLVHAVRRPLTEPRFTTLDPVRQPAGTFADFEDLALVDRASTGRVEVRAAWTEPVDGGPGAAAPSTRELTAVPFTQVVTLQGNANVVTVAGRHEFGDTKHRRISYRAVATSRFTEYFAETVMTRLTGTAPLLLDVRGIVPGSVTVTVPEGEFAEGRDYVLDTVAGTIARTDPSGLPSGQEVTVRFTPEPVTRSSAADVVRHLSSTARPPAPLPRYAVPAFAWSRERDGDIITSRRTGNTLRVYLDRPWHATGEGELLGVVLERNPAAPKPAADRERLASLVTLLAEDPVYGTATHAPPDLSAASFTGAAAHGSALLLEGAPERVDVAGHAVVFDAARGLWCCDVTVDPGPRYTPLLRLALVRYQPYSLLDLHLSPVALLDFAPLTPDRTVRVERAGADAWTLTVTGRTYLATSAGTAPARVVVTGERHDDAGPGELGWGPATNTVELVPQAGGSEVTWRGNLTLPVGADAEPARWRLLVEEFERLTTADTSDVARIAERRVFLDTVPLG